MPLLLAISGGKDSIVLLHYILNNHSDRSIGVVHINHGLRPESVQEELFVQQLAQKYNTPLHIRRLHLSDQQGNIEAVARQQRYLAFRAIQQQYGYQQIATAHTENDQLEQFFIRVFRGTSLDGLGGIPGEQNGIIRPLLGWSTDDIYNYIKKYDLDYMEDASNQDPRFLRNYIRHNIIPELNHPGYTPGKHILSLMAEIRAENSYFRELISDLLKALKIFPGLHLFPLNSYKQQHKVIRLKLLHTLLSHHFQLTPGREKLNNIDHIVEQNQQIKLSESLILSVEAEWVVIQEEIVAPFPLPLLPELLQLSPRIKAIPHQTPKKQNYSITTTYPGARMVCPTGSVKKIKDILINCRLPRFLRKRWPLIVVDGNIIAIPYLQ